MLEIHRSSSAIGDAKRQHGLLRRDAIAKSAAVAGPFQFRVRRAGWLCWKRRKQSSAASPLFRARFGVGAGSQGAATYFYLSLSTSVETRPARRVIRVTGSGIALIRGKICASRVETAPAGPCSKPSLHKVPEPPRR